jgi:hypothetical protein
LLIVPGVQQSRIRQSDLGLQFGYDLPDDKFRQPYMSRRVKSNASKQVQVAALGLAAYGLRSQRESS